MVSIQNETDNMDIKSEHELFDQESMLLFLGEDERNFNPNMSKKKSKEDDKDDEDDYDDEDEYNDFEDEEDDLKTKMILKMSQLMKMNYTKKILISMRTKIF